MNHFRNIHQFHQKFELQPQSPTGPTTLTPELMAFRAKFMQEELDEYKKAAIEGNLEDQLDALVDLVYVALGTAYLQRLPFNSAFARVHAANMKKIRALSEDESKRGSKYDVVKPAGWTPPSHADLIYETDVTTGYDPFTADLL